MASRKSANGQASSNATMQQIVSILVLQGKPRDTQGSRTTQLCVSRQVPSSTTIVNHVFELAGMRPHWSIRESTSTSSPREVAGVAGHVDVATISTTTAQQNDVLLATLRAIRVNPEWDHRNWFDDVLKKLRDKWPDEFSDAATEPCIDYTVNLLVAAPAD